MACLGCPSSTPSQTMLPGHDTNTRFIAGLLMIVFGKHWCLTCRPITQLSHHGSDTMAEWLRHLTRTQMGSSRLGSNPTRSSDSYSQWPDRKTKLPQGPSPPPTKARQSGTLLSRLGVSCSTPCSRALPFLEVCCSSCGKATAGTSSNKYHLYHQQVGW